MLLNGVPVGDGNVPEQSHLSFPADAGLITAGWQTIGLRAVNQNSAHYTVADRFTLQMNVSYTGSVCASATAGAQLMQSSPYLCDPGGGGSLGPCLATVKADTLNVRAAPGISFSILRTVTIGEELTLIARASSPLDGSSWYRVSREGVVLGWVSGDPDLLELLRPICAELLPLLEYDGDGNLLSTPTPMPTVDPNVTPTATLTPMPRLVAPEAQEFHARASEFGLPLPFDLWPVVEPDNYQNGYGPNWYADHQNCDVPTATSNPGEPTPTPTPDPCPYRQVNSIHPGVDYHTIPENSIVVALCDGIIVPGRREPRQGYSNDPYGGSAAGWGLTLRCFADDPNDPDGDGLRNLSNIIVVYNHLRIDQTVTNDTYPPDNAYQIVYTGQPLATTDESGTPFSHLDLQIYIADGHRSQNAIQLNPRFMNPAALRVDITGASRTESEQASYPAPYNNWSLQGRLEGAGRGIIHFWTQPSAEPFLFDVVGYLESRYPTGTRYIGPNCDNLPSGVDLSQSWWNSPNRIVECSVPMGLGDA
jgi:hypothetical protein